MTKPPPTGCPTSVTISQEWAPLGARSVRPPPCAALLLTTVRCPLMTGFSFVLALLDVAGRTAGKRRVRAVSVPAVRCESGSGSWRTSCLVNAESFLREQ